MNDDTNGPELERNDELEELDPELEAEPAEGVLGDDADPAEE